MSFIVYGMMCDLHYCIVVFIHRILAAAARMSDCALRPAVSLTITVVVCIDGVVRFLLQVASCFVCIAL